MTYKELYESAADKLEKSKITLGEFEEMIEPLNAEIATADPDTISRQAAIDALHTWFRNGFDEDRWWNSTHVLAVIEGLPPTPPAQLGTNLAEVGTDCISRQAAIDLLKQMRKDGDMIPWEGKDVFARIRKMPSAQPERIRGRWTRDNACSECGCQPWFSGDIHNYNFCPNCGAKMEATE